MFEDSPISKIIWQFYNDKFGQIIAPVGLLKACSVISAKFLFYPRLCLACIAPSRQFKSQTSNELMNIFSRKYWIYPGSDFTMHNLYKDYKAKLDRKCLLINDGTLLIASKSKGTKNRLVAGLSETITEGLYIYGNYKETLPLKARISMIMNMTLESYSRNKNELFSLTFLERFATIFYSLPDIEQQHYVKEMEFKRKISWDKKIRDIAEGEIENLQEFKPILIEHSKDISGLSVKSFLSSYDVVYAIAKAHAFLNLRNKLCTDDIDFLRAIKSYFIDVTAPNEHRIVQLRKEGRNQEDICLILGQKPTKYQPYVSRVIRKAKERGIL